MTINDSAPTRVVSTARGWLGTPYRHQASIKGVGCDCLGLLRGVWRELAGSEPESPPPYSSDWAETGRQETLLEAAHRHLTPCDTLQLVPGRVVVFRMSRFAMAKHVGIVSGPDRFIHAYEAAGVLETAFDAFWCNRIVELFDFAPPVSGHLEG
ncbi:MAG: NlpC/P60 family protein [Pseudomonadota bacterium]